MHRLKIHLILLVLISAFLFNIERLDLGSENALNIQTFVYVLALFVIVLTLLIPIFSDRFAIPFSFALVLYLCGKVLFLGGQSFWEGGYIYVAITEIALIGAVTLMSQRLAQSVYFFQEGFNALALDSDQRLLHSISDASADIRREITRSRHYHRPLSLIVVEPDQQSVELAIPHIFEELQNSLINRFTRVKLAEAMNKDLRLMDMILEENDKQFIILCPEVDIEGSAAIIERIQAVMKRSDIVVQCSTASFPEEALTFDGLLGRAKSKLGNEEAVDGSQ